MGSLSGLEKLRIGIACIREFVGMYVYIINELRHIRTLTILLTAGSRHTKVGIPGLCEFPVIWVVSEWTACNDS